ncbi:MAG: WYL domain-containing protein [Wujia sp.]
MAEIFSEIYNCYFQVVKALLQTTHPLSRQKISAEITEMGFEESVLYLLPKLFEDDWGFFTEENGTIISRLSPDFFVPLSNIQKSYLKTILLDEKIRLFLSDEQIADIEAGLADYDILYTPDTFYYYDRYSDRDDYADTSYKEHFRTLLTAIKTHAYVTITYKSPKNEETVITCLPCRLEYSIKNDRFRLLALNSHSIENPHLSQLNLSRMREVVLCDKTADTIPDINKIIQRSYYKEPVRLLIKNERNALERAMLQFANYDKQTRKIADKTYECLIYYNKNMETELLIEVLSFGPMIQVLGNDVFLAQLKRRIRRQMKYV